MAAVLVDAGPLIALFDRSDPHHAACRDALRAIRVPLSSVWPALTEALYLLGFSWDAQEAVFEMVMTDKLQVLPLGPSDVPRVRELMRKYRDLAMDFADAALVAIAERERIRTVFTLDRRDFTVYRPARLGRFTVIP